MNSVCIILRKPPYGTVDAAEAVRHALGGVIEELAVRLILLDAGVHAARKAQNTSDSEYDSIAEGISDCLDMDVNVYADSTSLEHEGLDESVLVKGVQIIDRSELSELITVSNQTMVF
jgi:sulfur relay (sulfurtransferase) DsrF/TusC family protein